MEARGFINSPYRLKKDHEDISKDDCAMNMFAWYMAFAGGMPLFIDSYSWNYIHNASMFSGQQKFLDNSATAAYLSLISNGGGLFYRGNRAWGYFYFHLNNALLYLTLREYSRSEHYDPATDSYETGSYNKNRALIYASTLTLSKIVEITHAIFSTEDLSSGSLQDEYVIPEPLFTIDHKGSPVYGISFSLRL
jgi:hypothetical protein